MARLYGKQSEYLQKKLAKHELIALVVLGLLFVIMFYMLEHFRELSTFRGSLILLLIIIPLFLLFYIIGNKSLDKSSSYRQGKRGEGAIWYELKTLSDEYCVFQDIKMDGGGNIDFVVLGPTGLFAIEVKSHSGEVSFNGRELEINGRPFEKDILKQAKGEALFINNYLKNKLQRDIFVQPVGVLSGNATMHFGLKPVNGVYVIQKSFLHELLQTQPRRPNFPQPAVEQALGGLIRKE